MKQNDSEEKYPSRVTIGISLPVSVYDRLKSAATAERRSLSNKVMQIITDYFAET